MNPSGIPRHTGRNSFSAISSCVIVLLVALRQEEREPQPVRAAQRFDLLLEPAEPIQPELINAVRRVAPGLYFALRERRVHFLHRRERALQSAGERPQRGLLELPPARPRAEDDVLLAAVRDHRHLWPGRQQIAHHALVRFAHRVPGAAHDEVRVVARLLRLVLVEARRDLLVAVAEAPLAGVADDRAEGELVVVGEGVADPGGEGGSGRVGAAGAADAVILPRHRR